MSIAKLQANLDRTFDRLMAANEDASLFESFAARRPSVPERLAAGRALREKVPRNAHVRYAASPDRADPVKILERQNKARVQKLVPVRYARMLASPFAFLRGSAAVMAGDLATTPVTGLAVSACGDKHVANFGVFASAERNLVFGINDFDELHPGPWEWDFKRLAASVAVAVRFEGGDGAASENAARAIVRSYRKRIRRYAEMGYLEVSPKARRLAERAIEKARAKEHITVLDKLTEQRIPRPARRSRSRSIGCCAPTSIPCRSIGGFCCRATASSIWHARWWAWEAWAPVAGSQGVSSDDPLFLQVKEAQRSVLAPHVDYKLPFESQGRRVVVGQRLTYGSPNIFLGWGNTDGKDFYVRQLADMKGSIKFVEGATENLPGFVAYCGLCGWALALAHAKSGDPAMIAGYCGISAALDDAIARFALAYLKQTDQDYEALAKARRNGRIQVATEQVVK